MRIFDWVLGGRDIYTDESTSRSSSTLARMEPAPWRKLMNDAVRVVADNAAEHVEQQFNRRGIAMGFDALGGDRAVVPSFDLMWMEYKTGWTTANPDVVHLNGGIVIRRTSLEDGHHLVSMGPTMFHLKHGADQWVIAQPFQWELVLDNHGVCLDATQNKAAEQFSGSESLTGIPLLALDWMNSNNLELVLHGPSAAVQRKRRKSRQVVGSDYYCIEIGRRHRSAWERQSGGVSAARFHTVAGSWATYGPENPRFGRAADGIGRFWRRQSTKGDKSLGVINKEYHVTAEAAQ